MSIDRKTVFLLIAFLFVFFIVWNIKEGFDDSKIACSSFTIEDTCNSRSKCEWMPISTSEEKYHCAKKKN